MKIKKTSLSQNSIVNLNFLQTKNYFLHDFKSKHVQLTFVKSLKIVYKYNACKKKIVFINVWPIVTAAVKHLVEKTKHKYSSNIRRLLLNKFKFKQNSTCKKDLLVLLDTKISGEFKVPSL
jgi:hypothetical protein